MVPWKLIGFRSGKVLLHVLWNRFWREVLEARELGTILGIQIDNNQKFENKIKFLCDRAFEKTRSVTKNPKSARCTKENSSVQFCNIISVQLLHGWRMQKVPFSLIFMTHILQWWNLAQLYFTSRRTTKYINHLTHIFRSADINIFCPKICNFCYIRKQRYRLLLNT